MWRLRMHMIALPTQHANAMSAHRSRGNYAGRAMEGYSLRRQHAANVLAARADLTAAELGFESVARYICCVHRLDSAVKER